MVELSKEKKITSNYNFSNVADVLKWIYHKMVESLKIKNISCNYNFYKVVGEYFQKQLEFLLTELETECVVHIYSLKYVQNRKMNLFLQQEVAINEM